MMAAQKQNTERLRDRLPAVRGSYEEAADLGAMTWFRVGGKAEILFQPADAADLADFLKTKPDDLAVTVLGLGSNLLVRDGGVAGVVIRLGRAFANIEINGTTIHAGAGTPDRSLAMACRDAGLAGLEFLSGIPGTLGGALRMNAGAYGCEMRDIVESADALDPKGERHRLHPDALGFSYRHSAVPQDWIFLSATLKGEKGERAKIAERIGAIAAAREETQPFRTRTGGSTFANPPSAKAWELIAAAGCRGLEVGGAAVSKKHCNFLINTGTATATDLETLGEEIRRRVFEKSGIELEWEIRRIGIPLQAQPQANAEGTP